MRFVSVEVKAVYIILSSTDARGESHYCDDAASQQFTADLSMEKIEIATSQLGSWECEKTDEADKDPADRQDSGPIVRVVDDESDAKRAGVLRLLAYPTPHHNFFQSWHDVGMSRHE